MPHGTAANRLRKQVLFAVLKRHEENVCYRCGRVIDRVEELSIDHKIPWSGNPMLFWDLDNIAFSHLDCNSYGDDVSKSRHGTISQYNRGCRCEECRRIKSSVDKRNGQGIGEPKAL